MEAEKWAAPHETSGSESALCTMSGWGVRLGPGKTDKHRVEFSKSDRPPELGEQRGGAILTAESVPETTASPVRRRILFLARRVPFPPDRGDKIATYHILRHLAARHDVEVACLADGASDLANLPEVEQFGVRAFGVPVSKWAARRRAALALMTGRPLSVAALDTGRLRRWIRQRHAAQPFDAVFVYSGNMAQFADSLGDIPRILHFSDLDSRKWAQYARRAGFFQRWIYALEAGRLARYEARVARAFTHSLLCTPNELEDLLEMVPGAPASCLKNGVDLELFQPLTTADKQPGNIVFTGVMDYFPNVDGVIWFAEHVLPLVRERVPGATFTIVGTRPTAAVRALSTREGVEVTGRIPDVRPYLARAEIAVVPLRMARGIQNKLLEAMAMGLPCVAATPAFTGADVECGRDVLVADEVAEFADHCVALLQDEQRRTELGRNAREAVERNYQWSDQLRPLDDLLAKLVTS